MQYEELEKKYNWIFENCESLTEADWIQFIKDWAMREGIIDINCWNLFDFEFLKSEYLGRMEMDRLDCKQTFLDEQLKIVNKKLEEEEGENND